MNLLEPSQKEIWSAYCDKSKVHDHYPSNNFQVPSLSWKREEERTDQRLFGVISLINLKIYKENMSQVSTIKYFFGDGGPTKSIKVNKSLSFLEWRTDQRLFGFYIGLSQDK